MLGAVLGDMVGSPYEGARCQNPKALLLTEGCSYTDDTVLTVAVAQALTNNSDVAQALRSWTRRHPGRGYGGAFLEWASSEHPRPYQSFSNGGSMRVSPAGLLAHSLDHALALATLTATPTHAHPEGLRGARAVAAAIYLARTGESPQAIREYVYANLGYDLSQTVQQRAQTFGFSTLAEDTVPDALTAALEATTFEQALRYALFIGGDSDTIACMAGGIAEARFGIPAHYVSFLEAHLPAEMLAVLHGLYAIAGRPCPLPGTATPATQEASRVVRLSRLLTANFTR